MNKKGAHTQLNNRANDTTLYKKGPNVNDCRQSCKEVRTVRGKSAFYMRIAALPYANVYPPEGESAQCLLPPEAGRKSGSMLTQ